MVALCWALAVIPGPGKDWGWTQSWTALHPAAESQAQSLGEESNLITGKLIPSPAA